MSDKPKTLGQVAYEAYCEATSGSGSPLPSWAMQSGNIRGAWEVAAFAAVDEFRNRTESEEEDRESTGLSPPRMTGNLWIEENATVTDAQLTALDNMESGVSRWLDH